MSLNSTPRTWVAAETVTAALMNTEARDALTGIQAAWDSYTPTWTAVTTNPVLGNGTLTGAWLRIGKTFRFRISLTMGSSTTYGTGPWRFALPAGAHAAYGIYATFGTASLVDTSASARSVRFPFAPAAGPTTVGLIDVAAVQVDATTPFTWANTDQLFVEGGGELA